MQGWESVCWGIAAKSDLYAQFWEIVNWSWFQSGQGWFCVCGWWLGVDFKVVRVDFNFVTASYSSWRPLECFHGRMFSCNLCLFIHVFVLMAANRCNMLKRNQLGGLRNSSEPPAANTKSTLTTLKSIAKHYFSISAVSHSSISPVSQRYLISISPVTSHQYFLHSTDKPN